MIDWESWEKRFGIEFDPATRSAVEGAVEVYHANRNFPDQATISRAEFKRALKNRSGDYFITRLVTMLTPEMGAAPQKDREQKAIARFEIDLVPVVREVDAFSDAVKRICTAIGKVDASAAKLTSLKWDDQSEVPPKPIDALLASLLRGQGCDLAQIKIHREALKRKEKNRKVAGPD
ncbi:hypothetical protein G5V65_21420 [Rhodobacter sp. HX-7-19]|uniref:Uncharacterized protein n=1 Tax=Paragemmobacter kunshanensis TaxID=2583234 RepID=A0A6M1TYS0_9RHOB|nr:hypothetical protein [Rhodobacter kunshanensis]NGQ93438.1 hypothetical protein [Rhodobacter kunshanensis]